VNRDKRSLPARAEAVNRPRNQLLAGARLTPDQNVGPRRGRSADEFEDLLDATAGADDLTHPFETAAQQQILHLQPSPFGGAADQVKDFLVFEGFGYVVEGSLAHRLDGGLERRVSGDHNHRKMGVVGLDIGEEFEAAPVRQHEIEEDDINLLLAEQLQPVSGRCGGVIVEIVVLQQRLEHVLQNGLVVYDEDASGSWHR